MCVLKAARGRAALKSAAHITHYRHPESAKTFGGGCAALCGGRPDSGRRGAWQATAVGTPDVRTDWKSVLRTPLSSAHQPPPSQPPSHDARPMASFAQAALFYATFPFSDVEPPWRQADKFGVSPRVQVTRNDLARRVLSALL